MDFYDNPVITNCQHAFCKNCIENYIGTKRFQCCPLCKNQTNLRSLKQFYCLNPYILKTKQLEEIFEKELSEYRAKTKEAESSSSETTVTNQQENQPPPPIESPSICHKRKKRAISTDESETNSKKIKSNPENELLSTNSVITSTRQEVHAPVEKSIGESTESSLTINRHLNDISKIPLTNKVEEWLGKNDAEITSTETSESFKQPEKTVSKTPGKSSICINKIDQVNTNKNNENLNQVLNKKLSEHSAIVELPIFDGSIDELSTDPNNMNKKELVINEADEAVSHKDKIENKQDESPRPDSSKIDFVEKLKLRFPSKSYFCKELHVKKFNPLKFTNETHNKSNNSMRHKSDSNLCSTTNTTPRLNRNSLLKTPKSIESKMTAPEFSHIYEQPLPLIDLSPKRTTKQTDSAKKSVRFKNVNGRPSLKRTQSDSNLSQSNQISLTCLNCVKHRKKDLISVCTMTEQSNKPQQCDQSTQCNFDDILEAALKDFDKMQSELVKQIYLILESESIDLILNEYFSTIQKELSTTVQSIPDSPPANRIEDTLLLSTAANPNTTQLTNETVNRRSTNFLNNFTHLLQSSAQTHKKSANKINQKRKPSLEFVNKNNGMDGSFLDNDFTETKKRFQHMNRIDDTYVPNQTIDYNDTRQNEESFIIQDTPVKNDQIIREDIKEINETLSKSASRLQAIVNSANKTIQNDKNDTILYEIENDKENLRPNVIPDTVHVTKPMIISDTVQVPEPPPPPTPPLPANDVFKEPMITQAPRRSEFESHSFLLNSLNMTNMNQNQIPLTNTSQNLSPKEIPLARDILGVSMANETMADMTLVNTLVFETKSLNQKQSDSVPKQTNNVTSSSSSSIKNKSETQLLTDSAVNLIEDICKDHYSIQNQTICEEPPSSKNRPPLSNISNKSNKNLEFAFSLLPSEMKSIINKYAQTNGIKVVNDILDTTTHLIVDADKNLLCGVTSKYLKAVSRKIWVVSVAWILNCINTGQMLKPDKFEIKGDKSFGVHNGPMNSRISSTFLFESFEFLFIGEFFSQDSVSLEDITQLVVLNGGIVRRKAKEFSIDDMEKKKVVLFDEKAKKISSNIVKSLKENNIDCVNKSWIIDSLACYKLRNLSEYQTYET